MACLENYVGHMMQLSLTDELSIGHMHSLPSAVIHTIKATFKHCKVYLAYKRRNDIELTSVGKNVIIVATYYTNSCICAFNIISSFIHYVEWKSLEPTVPVGHIVYKDLAYRLALGLIPSRNSLKLLSCTFTLWQTILTIFGIFESVKKELKDCMHDYCTC